MGYVDGFVTPLLKKDLKDYVRMARWGKALWMRHGALAFFECEGDDLKGMPGCSSFTKMGRLKANETVMFSFIVFKSRKHRDAVNRKVMAEIEKDPAHVSGKLPFDARRMAYGGFHVRVQG